MKQEKKLGLFAVTSLVLLNIAGTGIFFGPALSAREAGTSALLVWIWISFQSVYIGMLFSELVSLFPTNGGIYEYAKQAYGQFIGFVTGWCSWLVATAMTAILILSGVLYAFPAFSTVQTIAVSVGIIVFLSLIAYRGLGASEVILDAFAGVILCFTALTVFGGTQHISAQNFSPFFTASPVMLFVAMFFILETYFGWEAVTFMAEETKNPEKTIPKAMLIATISASVLGMLFAIVMFGMFGFSDLAASSTPLTDAFVLMFGDSGGLILRAGVFLSLVGSGAGMIISGPRLLQAMAREKLFIEQLSKKSDSTGTPARAIVFQAIVASGVLFLSLGEYEVLLSIVVPLSLFIYVATFLAVPVLRKKNSSPRPFSAPFAVPGSILVSLIFFGALIGWLVTQPGSLSIFLFAVSLVGFSVPIYLLLNIYYNPSTQLFFSDSLAHPSWWFESLFFPRRIRKIILSLFSDLSEKTVLELGSGVGSLTLDLAEHVTSAGQVIAVDAGKTNLDILLRRIQKAGHTHIKIVHDEHLVNRLHPDISEVDAVFSTGMIGYLQDKQKVLRELASIMPQNAPILFMEWVDYFGVLPNPAWLNDYESIIQEFKEVGFSVRIEKVKGVFWNYLLVYGIRTDSSVPFA